MTDTNTKPSSASDPIRILIVDDHAVVREGLRSFIQIKPDMEVVGDAADGLEAVEKALALEPDVILLDIVMPRLDGVGTIKKLNKEGSTARILVITSFAEDDQIFPAIKAGALGYLLKDSKPQELIQAIRDVYRGEPYLHQAVARKLMDELSREPDLPPTEDPLTERELEVLTLIAQGYSNREIGEELHLSERTVGKYASNILNKLHLANRTQVALYALRKGIVDLDPE
jgi:NarL family two-component system response regulator LiaR